MLNKAADRGRRLRLDTRAK